MSSPPDWWARHGRRVVALVGIVLLFPLARLPDIDAAERANLGARFQFSAYPFTAFADQRTRTIRSVHPDFEEIAGWISTVGAAIALNDLDGDGLPNDACYVDTESDLLIVAPVPGTGARFEPFTLHAGSLEYDDSTMAPMGCVPYDLNEDGLLDVLAYYWGRPPIAFLRRDDGSALSAPGFVPREIAPSVERWFTNAATFADIDGDGKVDLIVGNYFPDGSAVLDASGEQGTVTMHASMSDAMNGGTNHFLLCVGGNGGAEPDVSFSLVDSGLSAELNNRWTLGVAAADLDGDLLPELYFANDFGPDLLVHNRSTPGRVELVPLAGEKGFRTPNSKVLGRDSFKGMGCDFGDVNGDGRLDIHVSNIATEYGLEEAHFLWVAEGDRGRMKEGIAPFRDRGEELGLARGGWCWDTRFGDFDNDGVQEILRASGFLKGEINRWPELHETAMGNDQLLADPRVWHRFRTGDDLSGHQHNSFYVRASDGRFYDLAPEIGIDAPHVTRGIATADVDGDGDLDFAVGNQWEAPVFYANTKTDAPAFLGLELSLPVYPSDPAMLLGNTWSGGSSIVPLHPPGDGGVSKLRRRPAVGASVVVELEDGRKLVAQVDGGNGHSGVRSHGLHFGLDLPADVAASRTFRVEIAWRGRGGRVWRERRDLGPGWHQLLLIDGEVD